MRRRVAGRLRLSRATLGWDLAELARRTGLDIGYLDDLEAGQCVTLAFLPRIARAFGCSHLDFLDADHGAFLRFILQEAERTGASAEAG